MQSPLLRSVVRLFSLFILILCSLASLSAQLLLKPATTPLKVDVAYPYASARVIATKDGSPFLLTTGNVLIIENNYSLQPYKVDPPDAQGAQKLFWYTKKYPFTIVAFDQDGTAELSTPIPPDEAAPVMRFQTQYGVLREYNFGTIAPGKDTTVTIQVSSVNGRPQNGVEFPVHVDSISTDSPNFTLEWQGNHLSKQPPPIDMISPFAYLFSVTFRPDNNSYYRNKLTIYFEHGMKQELILIGNKFALADKTVLNVTSPNGDEFYSPCEPVTIRWKGSIAGAPTKVEYSTNAGKKWLEITDGTEGTDSTLLWNIPPAFSDSGLVRVSQVFQSSEVLNLSSDNAPVRRIAFRSDSKRLLAGNSAGLIREWDVQAGTKFQEFDGGPGSVFGLGYTASGQIAAAIHAVPDKFVLFTNGTSSPVQTFNLPDGFLAEEMILDPTGKYFSFFSKQSLRLLVYSASDGALVKMVSTPYPPTSFAFNTDGTKLVVAMLNGQVDVLSLPNGTVAASMNFPDLPVIIRIGLSSDGALLALGGKPSTATGANSTEAEANVVDIASKKIIRTFRNTASAAVGFSFSPTSRFLAIGFSNSPQVVLWNLITDRYEGSLSGHTGTVTDISFSPDGANIATSAVSGDNLKLHRFAFPESDISDRVFHIVAPQITIAQPMLRSTLLGEQHDTTLLASFCNTGKSSFVIERGRFATGTYFSFASLFPDTLRPGECLIIPVTFTPKDTGLLQDNLILTSCSVDYTLPIQAYGLNRSIATLADGKDFGELCIGDSLIQDVPLIRNDDPAPLKVNLIGIDNIASSPFSLVNPPHDTLLQPGQTLSVSIRFRPKKLGVDHRKFYIYHSGQAKVVVDMFLNGTGIGASVTFDQTDLRFIPELPSRQILLTNTSDVPITLTDIQTNPPGIFTITSTTPISIPPHQQAGIDVQWNTAPTADVSMTTSFTPCAVSHQLILGTYSGTSTVKFPVVTADPRGEAVIPVSFTNTENKPYNGERFFETEFTVNPRIFLPQSVSSAYGTATLVRNEIVGDKRIVGIRVEGNFPTAGVVAEVHGLAGLAEVVVSPVIFIDSTQFWGKSVTVTKRTSGEIRLINIDADRRLIQPDAISIRSVYPNPAQDVVAVETTTGASPFTLELYSPLGEKLQELSVSDSKPGIMEHSLSVHDLPAGTYRLILRQGTLSTVALIVVAR